VVEEKLVRELMPAALCGGRPRHSSTVPINKIID